MRNLILLRTIGFGYAKQDPWKAGHVVPIGWREIGAAIKWYALRGKKHRHGPATVTGHHLNGVHVDLIQIRPFFTIDFYVDEVRVHQFGNLFVFERLVLHHMTPMT